eukprot:sb/3469900/
MAINYDVSKDDRLDCSYIKENEIQPILTNVSCPRNASSLDSCSTSTVDGGVCDADSGLHLTCANDIPPSTVWDLVDITLARNPGGGHMPENVVWNGNFGTVIATLYNRENGTFLTGLVPVSAIQESPHCNTQAMYRSILDPWTSTSFAEYRSIGELEESHGKGLSCGYIINNDVNFLPVTSINCGCGGEVSIDDCRDILVSAESLQSDPKEALWLDCY